MTSLSEEYHRRAGEWSDIQGHLPTLYETVTRYPAAQVLELGVRSGVSTACLLAAVESVGGHLWSVDIAPPQVPDWWRGTGRWTLTVGDDVAAAVLAGQPSEVDVLFVDTNHVYEHTLAELAAYAPRVRPGGTVLCHDTELDLAHGGPPGPPFQVALALDTFCAEHGLAWENRTGSYGLGVIRIPPRLAVSPARDQGHTAGHE